MRHSRLVLRWVTPRLLWHVIKTLRGICDRSTEQNSPRSNLQTRKVYVYSVATLLDTPLQSNAIQSNSSAINYAFMMIIHFQFLLTGNLSTSSLLLRLYWKGFLMLTSLIYVKIVDKILVTRYSIMLLQFTFASIYQLLGSITTVVCWMKTALGKHPVENMQKRV